MAIDLTVLLGDGVTDGTGTFSVNPSGNVGQVLAGDGLPTNIFESELEGVGNYMKKILSSD
jgi:hypothetical protein